MPRAMIRAFGILKKATAKANVELGNLEADIGSLICAASEEVVSGSLDAHFLSGFGKQDLELRRT